MTNFAAFWPSSLALVVPLLFGCSKPAQPDARADSQAAPSAAAAPQPSVTAPASAAADLPEPEMLTHITAAWGKHGVLPPAVGIAEGQTIPDVGAVDETGRMVKLREAAKAGPLVLVFYRGGFCGFANFLLRSLAVQSQLLDKTGARFLLISSDSVEQAALTKTVHKLPWPVLSDPELKVIKAFKLDHQLTEAELADAERYKMKVPSGPSGTRPTLSYPATYVLGDDGKIKFAHADTTQNRMLTVDHIRDAVEKSRGKQP